MRWISYANPPSVDDVLGSWVAGLLTGLSLIIAIGAQNVFLLRQGLRREHVGVVAAVCAVSDLVLIFVGVAGLGAVVQAHPSVFVLARWFGAAFLLGYAVLAALRARRGSGIGLTEGDDRRGAVAVATTAAALTWLNPHVYLDTVLLLGSVAAAQGAGRWWFGLGAGVASLVWFSALGFGARHLAPLFRRPQAGRVLDAVVAVLMIGVAANLLLGS